MQFIGLRDTFAPDLHTGTSNLSVPIVLPKGRGGLQPELTLVYGTGQGSGPFDLRWSLGVPGFRGTRLSKSQSTNDEADVFLLSGPNS
jgi:hypothetical protein